MLSVIQSRNWSPTAQVLSGSTVVHVAWGLTRWHALGRAVRWAQRQGSKNVQVNDYAEED